MVEFKGHFCLCLCVNFFFIYFVFGRCERVEEGFRSNKLNCMSSGFSFQKSFNFSFFTHFCDRRHLFVFLLLLISSFCQSHCYKITFTLIHVLHVLIIYLLYFIAKYMLDIVCDYYIIM